MLLLPTCSDWHNYPGIMAPGKFFFVFSFMKLTYDQYRGILAQHYATIASNYIILENFFFKLSLKIEIYYRKRKFLVVFLSL